MIVTLTKLLVINIVANVRSESSLSCTIFASPGFFSGSKSSRSCGVRLKKAISEPLAKPDIISKKTVKMTATTTPVVSGCSTTRSLS